MADDFTKKVRSEAPFPWRTIAHPNGRVQVFDATGKEVPLFMMVEFTCFITSVMAAQKEVA